MLLLDSSYLEEILRCLISQLNFYYKLIENKTHSINRKMLLSTITEEFLNESLF